MIKILGKKFSSSSKREIDRYFIKSGLYVPGNQVKILISNKFCFTGKNVE